MSKRNNELGLKRTYQKGFHSMKKNRGWRAKRFFIVKVLHITEDEILIHNEGKIFSISRKKYPQFDGATDTQIRDVQKIMDLTTDNGEDDQLHWRTLDFDILMRRLEVSADTPSSI